MTAAIYYHPEAYTTSGPSLMGRNAAAESFLRGFKGGRKWAPSGPKAAVALVAAIVAERQAFVSRSLAWLLKLGVLKVCP